MKNYSDYSLHRLSDKSAIYKKDIKLWWSDGLARWMCTDTSLIKEILSNPIFEVPSYSVQKIVSKLPVDLEHNIKLIKYFPVAQDGESHKEIRKRHALQIAKNSEAALKAFEACFKLKLEKLVLEPNTTINLYDELIVPSFHVFLASLIDIDASLLSSSDSISQVLDETLPLTVRLRLNKKIGELVNSLPDNISEDEKYFKVSVIALGSDSLMGTMTESLVNVLKINNGKLLSEIKWPDEIPVTGVPVIERVITKECKLNDISLQANQRIRLYLDAAGYIHSETPSYSQLYFGSGNHLCLGMPIGRKIWKIIKDNFEKTNKKIFIQEATRREYDNVFNIYNTIKVTLNEQ